VQTETEGHVGLNAAPRRDVRKSSSQHPGGLDAGSGGSGLGPGRLGEEEGGDTVSGMTAHDAPMVDDALIRRSDPTATEGEVLGRGESADQR
jgi:hypothetical protein